VISLQEQLENKANFIVYDQLFLTRCMNCPDAGKRGKENWVIATAKGYCAHCGWKSKVEFPG
jgi:hypothetical protein